ncbi:MAG TPA: hypothetical protein VEH07_04740, partial [Alphaproteobacteria bacterium]|nr:hypothetical protein [Alphaproteobacteria bacterium]
VPHGTSSVDKAKAFIAFVQSKYGTGISAECHSSGTQASADSDKKIREDVDQTSKFPSKIIETGWMGS